MPRALTSLSPVRTFLISGTILISASCATAPPPAPPSVSFEQKMEWILQMEDQRILSLPQQPAPVIAQPKRGRPTPPPAAVPDLTRLAADPEARIRRRVALAIGRVGLKEGAAPLVKLFGDADAEVRQAAAFASGLIGDASSTASLLPLLSDPQPLVRGRAAEALGLIDAKDAAGAIGRMAAEYAKAPAVMGMQPDDEQWPAAAEAEAFKLGVFALVRLRAYDALASAVLDGSGHPVSTWWPIAYALQRIEDPRAVPALRELAQVHGRYTPAFAMRGLAAAKAEKTDALLLPLLDPAKTPREVLAAAIRACGSLGVRTGAGRLAAIASDARVESNLRLEAVAALGALTAEEQLPILQDFMTDEWPAMRAAALRAAAEVDRESFTLVLSGLDTDRHWTVRAALADILATLPPEVSVERLRPMLQDEDKRVVPSVLRALVRQRVPDAEQIVLAHLKESDVVIREVAARLVGQLKPAAGLAALRTAYAEAASDASYAARAAVLDALATYGMAEAADGIRAALTDKEWAVRIHAVELLAKIEPEVDHRMDIRPAPGEPPAPYTDPQLVAREFSPHAFIETIRGTIEFELAVVDAPQTSRNFMALARKGFFNGLQVHRVVPNFVVQDGDPRGDGEGGPGYSIRDELNDRPYLRGTVGMALAWRDTGGSQFFITHSPQPHLDAKYTVFGHVVNGIDVVDRIQVGDTIQRVRVWDGRSW
jgi:cyclophilin family peptidyl-prolyl cis-trans isomerase/HEAT repeat protein